MFLSKSVFRVVSFAGVPLLLTGCGANLIQPAPSALAGKMALSGKLYGGQQPVSGSHVYLFAAKSSGTGPSSYGVDAVSLLSAPGGYVVSDANGNFSFTGGYGCAAGDQVYAVALGGSPGVGTPPNAAIALMDAIGDCAQLTPSSFISINEVSTVAGLTALQQFTTINAQGIPVISGSAANVSGLVNAFSNATALVPFSSGDVDTTRANVTVPTAEIHTLANILASCVNTNGPSSAPCVSLFSNANTGVNQAFTSQAMLNIAQSPGVNAASLFSLSTANPPFQPALTSAPNDFTVGVSYGKSSLYTPLNLAIDGTGNAYVFDCEISCTLASPNLTTTAADKIVEFGPTGAIVNTKIGPAIHNVLGMALDVNGFLWTNNVGVTRSGLGNTTDSVGHFTAAGGQLAATAYTNPLISTPYGIVIDQSSNAYVTDSSGQNVSYVTSTGTVTVVKTPPAPAQPQGIAYGFNNLYFSDTAGSTVDRFNVNAPGVTGQGSLFSGTGISAPNGVALDANANVWVASTGGPEVTVITPAGTRIGPTGAPGFGMINAIAVDGNGRAWVPSCNQFCATATGGNTNPDSIVELQLNGSNTFDYSPPVGYQNSAFAAPAAVAFDASGNVWITNSGSGLVTVLVGAAGPVATPVQEQVLLQVIGRKP